MALDPARNGADPPAHAPVDAARTRRRLKVALVLASASVLALPLYYYAMFSGLRDYDDEGFLLMSFRQLAQGAVLYDELYAQYGPAYFQLVSAAFGLLGLDFDHTAARGWTLAVWLLTALLCGLATVRLTRSLPVAFCCQLFVSSGLWQLREEPLHPAGLLCLALSAIVLLGASLDSAPRPGAAGMIGALLAVCLLSKINIGIFAAVSTGFVMLARARASGGVRLLAYVGAVAMALIPWLLTAGHLDHPDVRSFALVVGCAALSVALLTLACVREQYETRREIVALAAGFGLVVAISCALAVARGTTLTALVRSTFLDRLGQPELFSVFAPMPPGIAGWAVVSLAVSLGVVVAQRRGMSRVIAAFAGPGQLLAGAVIWLAALRLGLAVHFIAPVLLAWIPLTACAVGSSGQDRRFGRCLLVALAVLQVLHVYPIPGSQIQWGTFLMIPVSALCVADGWSRTRAAGCSWLGIEVERGRLLTRVLATALVVSTAVTVLGDARRLRSAYDRSLPLGLPGTAGIRVPRPTAIVWRPLVRRIKSECRSLVTMPGINSLHLFSGIPAPTTHDASHLWLLLLDEDEQSALRDHLSGLPSPRCLVRSQPLLAFWLQGRDPPDGPIRRYLDEAFVPYAKFGHFELLVERR